MNGDRRSDLSVDVFLALREHFFDRDAVPRLYSLRDKRNTQDDPLDERIHQVLQAALSRGVEVETSGPLTTPDLVVYRPGACERASRTDLREDPKLIFALEVKKLERTESGQIARASGLDYNTTPPCGRCASMMATVATSISREVTCSFARNPCRSAPRPTG